MIALDSKPAPRRWTLGTTLGLLVILATTLATGFAAQLAARVVWSERNPAPEPAQVNVQTTDGSDTLVWLTRDGHPERVYLSNFTAPPGEVSLKITRHNPDHTERTDVVRMNLMPGRQHLVVVGSQPIVANGAPAHFYAPGVLATDGSGVPQIINANDPSVYHPLARGEIASFSDSDSNAHPNIRASDHVLLIVNPYLDAVSCTVHTDDWSHEISLAGPQCGLIVLGDERDVRLDVRLASNGLLIERQNLHIDNKLPLYTVGGRTIYRWSGGASPSPALPQGWLANFPSSASVRILNQKQNILEFSDGNSPAFTLSPVVSSPAVFATQDASSIRVQRDLRISEISAQENIRSLAVSGNSLLGLIGGRVFDLSTQQSLLGSANIPLQSTTTDNSGITVITGDGRLVSAGSQIHTVSTHIDPTMHMIAVSGEPPAVWLFGGVIDDALIYQPLSGSSPQTFPLSGITAATTLGDDLLIARGRRIDRITPSTSNSSSEIHPIAILPDDPADPIVGIADLGGRLVFSTRQTIYTVVDNIVVPVLEGIGGRMQRYGEGLIVHDSRTLKLYSISLPAPSPQNSSEQTATDLETQWPTAYEQWKTRLDQCRQHLPALSINFDSGAGRSIGSIISAASAYTDEFGKTTNSLQGRLADIAAAQSAADFTRGEFDLAQRQTHELAAQIDDQTAKLQVSTNRSSAEEQTINTEDETNLAWERKLADWHDEIELKRRDFQLPQEQAALDAFNAEVQRHNVDAAQYGISLKQETHDIEQHHADEKQLAAMQHQLTDDRQHLLELRNVQSRKRQVSSDSQDQLDKLNAKQAEEAAALMKSLGPSLASLEGLMAALDTVSRPMNLWATSGDYLAHADDSSPRAPVADLSGTLKDRVFILQSNDASSADQATADVVRRKLTIELHEQELSSDYQPLAAGDIGQSSASIAPVEIPSLPADELPTPTDKGDCFGDTVKSSAPSSIWGKP